MKQINLVSINQTHISIDMLAPKEIQWNQSVMCNSVTFKGHYLNTGVPHFVVFVKNCERINVHKWGSLLRHHLKWQPKGVNVNFVEKVTENSLKVRTFERGVENETLGCGTGATAAALTYSYLEKLEGSVSIKVSTRSKDELDFSFLVTQQQFSQVVMRGSAQFVFAGKCDLASFF